MAKTLQFINIRAELDSKSGSERNIPICEQIVDLFIA